MKSCEHVRTQLSAYLDGELPETGMQVIAQHLQQCAPCSEELDGLKQFDLHLKSTLRVSPDNSAINRIQTLLERPQSTVVTLRAIPPKPSHHARGRVTAFLMSALAVFSVALLIHWLTTGRDGELQVTQDGQAGQIRDGDAPGNSGAAAENDIPRLRRQAAAASLVRATGPVDIRQASHPDWESLVVNETVRLFDGCHIRTQKNSLCEIKTTAKGKLRLDENSEIQLCSAESIHIFRGTIWCESSAPQTMTVAAVLSEKTAPVFTCPENGSAKFQCSVTDGKSAASAFPNTSGCWTLADKRWTVSSGETLQIDRHANITRSEFVAQQTPLWQLPLLAMSADDERELKSMLSPVLELIGRTKARHMSEAQIRQLGPSGAIPLLVYVDSEKKNQQSRSLRYTAMRIACETADESATSLLLRLASDSDRYIARLAATTLRRLKKKSNV